MTYDEVKKLFVSKGYEFKEQKMALNLYGIRSKTSQSDKFDDLGGIAYIDENGVKQAFNFWMTTDPGKYWLTNPMKRDGTIILVPGQYKDCYKAGKHNGKYEAFVQNSSMAYVRDNDRDTTLDFSLYRDSEKRKKHLFWGINGTNFHRASEWNAVPFIGQYSAGCQVVQKPETFKKLIELRDKSISYGFNTFNYTLFEE